jgi:hypothetical protein
MMWHRSSKRPSLSDSDVELILELLESERANLPSEIRRTNSPKYQDRLRRRLGRIDRLVTALELCLTPNGVRASSARANPTAARPPPPTGSQE